MVRGKSESDLFTCSAVKGVKGITRDLGKQSKPDTSLLKAKAWNIHVSFAGKSEENVARTATARATNLCLSTSEGFQSV